jgi:mRNA interferase MazF
MYQLSNSRNDINNNPYTSIKEKCLDIKRGDIFLVKMNEVGRDSSIQGGVQRPCVILSNDKANYYSPVISVAPFTSRLDKTKLPTHITLDNATCGLKQTSIALIEQTMLIDKNNLIRKVGRCNEEIIQRINMAIMIQMGIYDENKVDELVNRIHSIDDRANVIGFDIEDADYRSKLIGELKIYCEQINCDYLEKLNKKQNKNGYKKAI